MTIAITPFDGLCGFRPLAEISHYLSTVPSLRKLVGDSAAENFEKAVKGHETSNDEQDLEKNKKALQNVFSALMKCEKSDVSAATKDLLAAAKKEGESFAGNGGPSNGGQELADLVIRLNSQFEGDIGLFVLFFLNYVKLEVGEAMFLKADDIHAYLSGGTKLVCLQALDFKLTLDQTSWSVWPRPTMLSVPGLLQNSRTYQLLQPCLLTPMPLFQNRK